MEEKKKDPRNKQMANNLGEFQMAKRKRGRLFIAKDKAATNLPTQ